MKALLIMADAATTHPDGTFSLLRGGINQVNIARNNPIAFKGALTTRISATPSERGAHMFRIVCTDQDGQPVGEEMKGNFAIPPEGGAGCFVTNIELIFPRHGRYQFALSVDGHELDTWMLETKEVAPTQVK